MNVYSALLVPGTVLGWGCRKQDVCIARLSFWQGGQTDQEETRPWLKCFAAIWGCKRHPRKPPRGQRLKGHSLRSCHLKLHAVLFFFFFKLFILCWGVADEQRCDSSRWATEGLRKLCALLGKVAIFCCYFKVSQKISSRKKYTFWAVKKTAKHTLLFLEMTVFSAPKGAVIFWDWITVQLNTLN